MEFFNKFTERKQQTRENEINEQALDSINLADFDNKIYIAYNDAPLIPIEETWTTKEILNKLKETRDSYINYKMTKLQTPRVASIFI